MEHMDMSSYYQSLPVRKNQSEIGLIQIHSIQPQLPSGKLT